VATAPETWILLPGIYALQEGKAVSEYSHTTAARAILEFVHSLPGGVDAYLQSLSRFATDLYDAASTNCATYFLDKTPRYYLIILEIARMFPEAKFIFLFRNPLEVLSSMINTWHNGRVRLHGNWIDLMRGPILLAEAWSELSYRSHRVIFDELVQSPEKVVREILDYLELRFQPIMLQEPLKGTMGDKIGQMRYDKIDSTVLEKWKTTLANSYRKRFALRYLDKLGPEVIAAFGHSHDELCSQVRCLSSSRGGLFRDIMDQMLSYLIRRAELPLQKSKLISSRKREPLVLHN
jgi:hypothetical protein